MKELNSQQLAFILDIKKAESGDKAPPYKISIPPALASILSGYDSDAIYNSWEAKFGKILKF